MNPTPKLAAPPAESPHASQNVTANLTGTDDTVHSGGVTFRAFTLGLILAAGMAALNCWIETVANVHFLGGVQMPFGAIFVLLFFVLAINGPLRLLHHFRNRRKVLAEKNSRDAARRDEDKVLAENKSWLRLFSRGELLTLYSMLLPAALISTPGTDNFYITTGPALFYFSTRENGWANLFYQYIPSWFAPGWNGQTYQKEVIEPLYLGGMNFAAIPWHAWSAMIIAWSIFLLLVYSAMFFLALLLRKQWIENEALAFPLVQLPLQMVETDGSAAPPARTFWANRAMWMGFGIAAIFHVLRGMNNYYPDWPVMNSFQGNAVSLAFTERPWSVMGSFSPEIFFGGIGIAYLLTRDLAFSFWFFYLTNKFQLVAAEQLGFPPAALSKGVYNAGLNMVIFQGVGGWSMMAILLLWTARGHLTEFFRAAMRPHSRKDALGSGEPFAPRLVLAGLLCSVGGLLAWSWFAGINVLFALAFFGIYLMVSMVLARIVVEGGYLFPQVTFSSLEWMTTAMFGASALGAGNMAKLSFLQPVLMNDMRTNTLPAFLHTMKMAQAQNLSARGLRRLLGASAAAVVVAMVVTTFISIITLYSAGGLSGYTWFTVSGPQAPFKGVATIIKSQPGINFGNFGWMAVGAGAVWLMMLARSHFLWFPLHPLGYLVVPGAGNRLWFSFFIGWLAKTLIIKFGGNDSYIAVRPFMIGLILGNVTAMIFWMIAGFFLGTQIQFWPA